MSDQAFENSPPLGSHLAFTEDLRKVRHRAEKESFTLHQLIETLGPRGHAFLALFLALPFMQPIPLIGVSTPFGLGIVVIGFDLIFKRPLWLPAKLGSVKLPQELLVRICVGLETVMRQLERFVKARGQRLFSSHSLQVAIGLALIVHGVLLSLPLPIPFSNFFPALVLVLFALGLLEEDIAMVALGSIAAVCNAVYFAVIVIAPLWGMKTLWLS